MPSFRLLIDYDVMLFVEGPPRSAQRLLRDRRAEIRDHPVHRSDYVEHDAIGRRVDINICGAYALKFWVDHADRQVKILDIHPADRRQTPS
jgi:hypothetical protein